MNPNLKSRSQMKRIAIQDPHALIVEIEDLRAQKKYLLKLLEEMITWQNEWDEIKQNVRNIISESR